MLSALLMSLLHRFRYRYYATTPDLTKPKSDMLLSVSLKIRVRVKVYDYQGWVAV